MSFIKARELLRIAEMAKARYRGVSLRDIMSELSVNERTARRMARELEDLCPKVMITDDENRRRWWKLTQAPLIDHRVVSEKELSALDLAIRRAVRDGAENEVVALQRVRDHLVASVPRPHARSAEVSSEIMMIANGFACRPGPAARIRQSHLEILFNAFIHPTIVEITYTSARDPKPRTKLVEPHGVIVGTRHYLVARDALVGADRRFKQYRLDRVIEMKGTATFFERDPDFDIETYCTFAFGSFFSDAEYRRVRWRFKPRAAPVARDFVFHPKQVVTDLDDGSLLVEFTASGWVEMAWHLMSWGAAVEVLEPPELIAILEHVRRGEVDVLP
jgi:predicted DNA-binding transcriptional regulator YafY